jgi:hypothetical protein
MIPRFYHCPCQDRKPQCSRSVDYPGKKWIVRGNRCNFPCKTMNRYDPLRAPDPEQWQLLDEDEQIEVVQDYHRRARIRLPNAKAHAIAHAVVESQIALGDETPVQRTIQRLMLEGLDRHDAIHAVGLVLMSHMNDMIRSPNPDADPNVAYFAALEQLTAKEWLRSG